MSIPRVAFFADSFHEVNGVARTSRELARFAQEREYPLFSVHTGPETHHFAEDKFETYEIGNSRALLRLETDLAFDLLFLRHLSPLAKALARFQPDLIHVTGPSHCGLLGAILARQLGVPLVASWHTNLHEYAARRLNATLHFLPTPMREGPVRLAESVSLSILLGFYRMGKLLFAPNPELVDLLASKTHRPTHPMQRGVDTALFSPERRERSGSEFRIGYVGRLSTEKNVRMLFDLERTLISKGLTDYRFLVIGEGCERSWLAANMLCCDLPGVLHGADLAKAYASMDVFVFPFTTDTFGNVILEAMASGVPVIVSAGGGPKYLVESGITGFVAQDVDECAGCVLALGKDTELRQQMSLMSRRGALNLSWDAVFGGMYQIYDEAVTSGSLQCGVAGPSSKPLRSSVA